MVRYPRCFTPIQNYALHTKSIALNEVRRFNFVALKRAKSQRCFGVVLMWMDLLRWEHDTLSFYIYIYINLKIWKTFPCCTVIWKCSSWSRHVCRFSLVCTTQSACCMPCLLFVLVGVWTATVNIKVHRLCLCVWLQTWETELQRAAHVAARLSVGLWLACVQCRGCSNVQTVSFHWRCMAVRAFRSVYVSVTLWRTQPEAVVVCTVAVSRLFSLICHLLFVFPSLPLHTLCPPLSSARPVFVTPPAFCHVCSSILCATETTCSRMNA